MTKKKLVLVIDIILVLVLIGIMALLVFQFTRSDASKFKSEYEALNGSNVEVKIPKDNPIKYSKISEIFEILEGGTGVIYFGFPGCPWCRNMLPILFDSAKNNNIDTIYYFNPKKISASDNEDYNKLINMLKEFLDKDENGDSVLYVPDVYFVKDGEIVGHHASTVKSQKDPTIPLTDEQKDELLQIFDDLFSKLNNIGITD